MSQKCALCGGPMPWYNSKIENPDGEGYICEKCIKNNKERIKEAIEKGKSFFYCSSIIENPDKYASYPYKYLLIRDQSTQGSYVNLIKAINLLAERGWRCLNVTSGIDIKPMSNVFQDMYALMEKIV